MSEEIVEQSLALTLDQKKELLTERELREYQIYMRLGQPPMAKSTQAQFFALFLNGDNCEGIVRLNPNGFSLGAVVRARIENDWDMKRREHQANLLQKSREKVQQIVLETVERVSNELAASNKLINDRAKKFLQTGDPAELAGTGIGSQKHLKDSVELLQKLTGQDVKKQQTQVDGFVEHRHVHEQATPTDLPVLPAGKPVAPEDAARALEVIRKNRQGKK